MNADQLSQSAAFIAIKFYGLTREERFSGLFEPSVVSFYEKVVRSLPAPLRYYHYWLRFQPVRSLYIAAEELLLPGDLLHVLARKWYINKMTEELISDGYEQILVLGTGFDHLGFRYNLRGIPSLEVDTPRMARLKKRFLQQHYPDKEKHHPVISALCLPGHSLARLLQQQQTLSADKKTIIVAEGFFDYLEKQAVEQALAAILHHFASPALVSTHFALDELAPFHRWVFQSSLKIVGEKPKLGLSMKDFKALLHKSDLHRHKIYRSREIKSRMSSAINTDLSMLGGFYLLSAQ